MTLVVSRYDGDEKEWDDFAREQAGFTHMHRFRWRSVIEKAFGHECIYLSARDDSGKLVGLLPLVRVRSVVFGHYLVSMPFLNYGGPLGSAAAVAALVDEATELAASQRVKLLELRSPIAHDISLEASHRKITVVLDLPATASEMFKRFDPKLRSQIRRPQKAGATVLFGHGQVRPFFQVFARNMRDLGTPALPLRFFEEIASQFPEDSLFACVYIDGRPVAAACGFRFGSEFEMTWASSLRSYNKDAPNMLLYWACIENAICNGVTRFNFGRCSPGSGTHRFKLQWGGREEALYWYGNAATSGAKTPSPDDAAYSWGPRVWRRLPTSIATTLGPSIVRYIP
jgi:FemAB-related protein (PEP-CTERM system-associated)